MTRPVLVTTALAAAVVLVAGSAAAASPKKKTPAIKKSPATRYSVINGTANAASDHVILASSAFPNFTNGAVDNYYSMAQSHVDNSPFAEGTASPADTGPIGQTAAAGNFQQPQYADARWPGDSGKAEYGNQGGPYATAAASKYLATADASEASNGLSSPSLPAGLALPNGFDGRLRQVLAAWKAKWQGPLGLKKPTLKDKLPAPPTVTVPTPVATVTTPTVPVGGVAPAPPVTVPVVPPMPRRSSAPSTTPPSRSMASASSSSPSGDGEAALESSTRATVDPKTHMLVTSGESRLGRVSLGGGQIVIEGIHVSATITNGSKPKYTAAVSIASATIGGIPVTIDQDGVHIAGQGQALPYQQASNALNGALKQAGIQIFLVAPEVTKGSPCDQPGSGSNSGGSGGGSTTTTTSSNQSGPGSSPSSCDQTGQAGQTSSCDSGGAGTPPAPVPIPSPTSTTSSSSSSCGQPSSCDQTSTTTGPTSTTPSSTSTSTNQTSTTSTSSSCGQTGSTGPTGSCASTGKGSTTPTGSNDQTTGSNGLFTFATTNNSAEEKVTATGVHLVFTQPTPPPGVPAQHVEHILGEVSLDSLAVPQAKLPKLAFGLPSSSSSSARSCLGGSAGGTGVSGSSGLSSSGGSTSSGIPSSLTSSSGSAQPTSSSSGGGPLPTQVASFLKKKPLWVLVAFLLWQALAVGTAVSLLRWRKDGAP